MSADLPALLGGPAVRPQCPPDWPGVDETIRDALLAAWGDGSWGVYQGGHVAALEDRLVTAATVLTMVPIVVVFFFAQRAFVQGVTLTGVKG